jgi:hypothetical protein
MNERKKVFVPITQAAIYEQQKIARKKPNLKEIKP